MDIFADIQVGIMPVSMFKILSLFFLIVSGIPVFAQTKTPKYSNEFLSIGVGARGLGMSGSQVAHVKDATSGFWNPAGLLQIKSDYEIALMHAEYFAGISKYDYASVAVPLDTMHVIGFSIIRFAVDDIPDTRFLYDANGRINYDNIRFFSAADYAFIFSYARKTNFVKGLSLGANAKVVHRSVGKFANAWGFGLDVGAQLQVRKWQLGLLLKDITTTFNVWSHNPDMVADVYAQTGNEIPESTIEITLPKAIIGVARAVDISSKLGLLASLDLDFTFDGKRNVPIKSDFASIDPHLGIEVDYVETVFLRFGVGNIQQIKDFDESTSTSFQPNFGVGAKIKKVNIDYALTDIGDQAESLYSHVVSLLISL